MADVRGTDSLLEVLPNRRTTAEGGRRDSQCNSKASLGGCCPCSSVGLSAVLWPGGMGDLRHISSIPQDLLSGLKPLHDFCWAILQHIVAALSSDSRDASRALYRNSACAGGGVGGATEAEG